jgi:hypothetical protein
VTKAAAGEKLEVTPEPDEQPAEQQTKLAEPVLTQAENLYVLMTVGIGDLAVRRLEIDATLTNQSLFIYTRFRGGR